MRGGKLLRVVVLCFIRKVANPIRYGRDINERRVWPFRANNAMRRFNGRYICGSLCLSCLNGVGINVTVLSTGRDIYRTNADCVRCDDKLKYTRTIDLRRDHFEAYSLQSFLINVVAYYLVHLMERDRAAAQAGFVTSVTHRAGGAKDK